MMWSIHEKLIPVITYTKAAINTNFLISLSLSKTKTKHSMSFYQETPLS